MKQGLLIFLMPVQILLGAGGTGLPTEPSNASATSGSPLAPKFKRRVLLTVFLNEHQDKDREYLSASIPDAFANPLVETQNFVILNRKSVVRYLEAMGITPSEVYDESNAVGLGKAIGADVVLVGKFSNASEEVLIEAKAVDVQTGRTSVEAKTSVKTNSNMFDAINAMARQMSTPMAEKMQPMKTPPPPAEVVLTEGEVAEQVKQSNEKKGIVTRDYAFAVSVGFALENSLGSNGSVFPTGLGGILSAQAVGMSKYFSKKNWFKPAEIGIVTGYLVFPATSSAVRSLTQVPLYLTVGYGFPLPLLRDFKATPLLSGGLHLGSFSSDSTSVTYTLPAFAAGGRISVGLLERYRASYTLLAIAELDNGANFLLLHGFSIGFWF
jgi:TolB-like protein